LSSSRLKVHAARYPNSETKMQQLQHHRHCKTSCFGISTLLQNIFSLQQLTASPIISV